MPTNPYDSIIDPNSNNEDQIRQDAWNRENDGLLSSWLNPGSQQREEFAQQVLLQQMQNNWNAEDAKMDRMKKAGINANVAAAGIAGAGAAPSTGSPNSAVGAGAQGVASAAQAAGAVNEAVNAGVNAYEKFSLTGVERDKRKAEIRDLLASATHNEWLAYAVSELLPEQKREVQANTYLKLAQYENAKEEFFNIQKEYEVKNAEVKRIKAERDLAVQQKNYVAAEQLKVEAETAGIELDNWKKNRDKEWYEKYGYDRNNPVDNILIDGMISGNDEVVGAVGESVKLSTYSERKGFNKAEIEDVYTKVFNEIKANAAWKPYLSRIEADKQHLIDLVETQLENPSDIKGFVAKLMNLIGNILGVVNLEESSTVAGANPPTE